jgi:hypothetical protein
LEFLALLELELIPVLAPLVLVLVKGPLIRGKANSIDSTAAEEQALGQEIHIDQQQNSSQRL